MKTKIARHTLLLAGLTTAVVIATVPALAQQTFTVDRLTDIGEGEGLTGDLRYCITQAGDGDTITFDVTGTINLTRALPDLTRSINIEGPGANRLTVRRNTGGSYRIFTVIGGPVRTSGLTIANGVAVSGGGVYNRGTLTISHSTISGNTADGTICNFDCYDTGGGWRLQRGNPDDQQQHGLG